MRTRIGSRAVIALTALAVLATATAGYAHRRGLPWWFNPPTAAVADGTTFDGNAEDATVRTIVTTGRRVTSYARADFDDGTFTAAVAAGQITIDEISLTTAGGSTLTVTLDPATLARNFINSTFFAEGTATIAVPDATDPTIITTTTVPVFVFGSISTKNGEYRLRAEVRGLSSVDDGAGNMTHTLLRLELEAETAVPTATAS